MLDVRSLRLPVLGAPMAGGPSSPELVGAVSLAGGLGMLPGGSISAERFRAGLVASTQVAGAAPIGANLFVPRNANTAEPQLVDIEARESAVKAFAASLAATLDVDPSKLGTPNAEDDEDWEAKLELLEAEPVALVTFTFGLPDPDVFERLHAVGSATGVMVTDAEHALAAAAAGADVIIAQGAESGGHRSTWRVTDLPNETGMLQLVGEVRASLEHEYGAGRPVIVAAGAIGTAERFRAARDAGADTVQLGTALLLADEAGTSKTFRAALTSAIYDQTLPSRAFSGRVARAVRNGFVAQFATLAPPAYPEVNQLTAPLRAAADARGDVDRVSAYAGTAWRQAREAPVAEILRELVQDSHH